AEEVEIVELEVRVMPRDELEGVETPDERAEELSLLPLEVLLGDASIPQRSSPVEESLPQLVRTGGVAADNGEPNARAHAVRRAEVVEGHLRLVEISKRVARP